ncbi:conserved hypothetical protein; putative CP4-57 prophage protein [Herminiimonas arsenicoxydans]|uniref:DUF3987 domain-containing protein n=1 Tax=Herminiimonas arsenicoxydans TaxID=204773 RepID=A4G2E8_HERAR|nr:conserved hypothetical protein; putative CP4-57 prophage protein [Herminiimonas arsenicoxydans]
MNNPFHNPPPVEDCTPVMKKTILEIHAATQAPLGMILATVLFDMTLSVQNSIDVRRPNGSQGPVSTIMTVLADSGERKSTVANEIFSAVEEVETEENKKTDQEMEGWKIQSKLHAEKLKGVLAAIRKAMTKGKPTEELDVLYLKLVMEQPVKPKRIRVMFGPDITLAALKYALYETGSSVAIVTDEGGEFYKSNAAIDYPFLNSAWGGVGPKVSRRTSESFSVPDVRLSLLQMVQNALFQEHENGRGSMARASGYHARGLICRPASTQGFRWITAEQILRAATPVFTARVKALLRENIAHVKAGTLERIVMEFSPEAAIQFNQTGNRIEGMLQPGQPLCEFKDHASKLGENIARVAAVLEYFEYGPGPISADTLRRASEIVQWFSSEFQHIFGPGAQVDSFMSDINKFGIWLNSCTQREGKAVFEKSWVQRNVTFSLRGKARLEPILDHFVTTGQIRYIQDNKKTMIEVNPAYFQIGLFLHYRV